MTPEREIDALGERAWRTLAEEMKRTGAPSAIRDLFTRAPQVLHVMADWLQRQPIERRMGMCDEFFGTIETPPRR